MWFFNWLVFIIYYGNGIIDLFKKGIKIRLFFNFSIISMDFINILLRIRLKCVYDYFISGFLKNVENSVVKSLIRRKLNFDVVVY